MYKIESKPFIIHDGQCFIYNKGDNIEKFLKPIEYDYLKWLNMYRIIENYNKYSE